jgi:transcriptional regulator of NAD metabolism
MPESPNIIGQLAIQYSNRPAIKALLKLIPGGSSADTLLQKRADEIKDDRVKVFFEELAQGKRELTDDLIQTEDFLHSYFCTLRAALNCRQREKIKNFARLLDSSLDPMLQVSSDEHEELLTILEEITVREFAILSDLRNRELAHSWKEGENALEHALRYWGAFKTTTVEAYVVPAESFNAFMARLERTRLYLRITGYYDHSDIGATTPLLARLILLVSGS